MATDRIFSALSGRLSVVTGASSGIGLAYCRLIASHGGHLLMVSNQGAELTAAAADLRATYGVDIYTLCVDLSQHDAAVAVNEAVAATGQTPVLLINNAGIFDFAPVNTLSDRRIDMYIDLHMRTMTRLCIDVSRVMAQTGEGYILNMSSMSCWMAMPGIAMYAATKAYIHTFSRALRIELLDSGVSVTVACPGGIATGLFGLSPRLRRLGVSIGVLATPERFVRQALKRTLRRRPQYINGLLNRLSIVVVASLPEWARRLVKHKLLDR